MEAEFISETFALMYQISLRHIPDDRILKHIYIYIWIQNENTFKYETYQLQVHYQKFNFRHVSSNTVRVPPNIRLLGKDFHKTWLKMKDFNCAYSKWYIYVKRLVCCGEVTFLLSRRVFRHFLKIVESPINNKEQPQG